MVNFSDLGDDCSANSDVDHSDCVLQEYYPHAIDVKHMSSENLSGRDILLENDFSEKVFSSKPSEISSSLSESSHEDVSSKSSPMRLSEEKVPGHIHENGNDKENASTTSNGVVEVISHSTTDSKVGSQKNACELEYKTPQDFPGKKIVGVDGFWYDVTTFLPRHPGGPILEHFIGEDASVVFHANGHDGVLKHRTPIGRFKTRQKHSSDDDFIDIVRRFRSWGWFETDWWFLAGKVAFTMAIFTSAWMCVLLSDSMAVHYLGAALLAFFWQQCGYFMHECMHGQYFKSIWKNELLGMLFGTTGFGISSHWWKDEHILHHSVTNMISLVERFVDPQMWEPTWAQHPKLFPLFNRWFHVFTIKVQHFTFIPVVVFIGRLDIVFDSFIGQREPRLREWAFWIPHWIWLCTLLSFLPTWNERLTFYAIAASVQGIFHFQLILSHYCREHFYKDEMLKSSWYVHQILTNMNLDNYWWSDWFYGGLNFHIEHHVTPLLQRKYLRKAGKYIKEICDRHNIEYLSVSFPTAVWITLKHLRQSSIHYSIDPR